VGANDVAAGAGVTGADDVVGPVQPGGGTDSLTRSLPNDMATVYRDGLRRP
jgi:hypothetical protein